MPELTLLIAIVHTLDERFYLRKITYNQPVDARTALMADSLRNSLFSCCRRSYVYADLLWQNSSLIDNALSVKIEVLVHFLAF